MATESAASGAPPAGRSDQVFVRKSSGLIKSAGAYDVLIYNIGLISIGIGLIFNQFYGPMLYPGADVVWATILAGVGMTFVALSYYFWTVTFPRSGGNYVFISRGLSPGLGFSLTVLETVVLIFYSSLAATLFTTVGIENGLAAVGIISNNSSLINVASWFGTQWGIFITASLIMLFGGLLPLFGMRRFFVFQRWAFVIAIVGTLTALGVVLLVDNHTFAANLNRLTGLDYQTVIDSAKKGGWAFSGFTLPATIAFIVWPLLPLQGGVFSVGIGGEIKRVGRDQMIGMVVAMVAAAIIIAVMSGLANRTFGYEFEGSVAYNFYADPAHSTAVTPYFTLLSAIASDNIIITLLIVAAFAAWSYFWIPAELIYTQRTMLAWSFDRLAPERLSYVHPKYHTPVVAIAITIVLGIAFVAVIAFTTYGTLVLIEGSLITWSFTLLAGVLFPFIRKELFAGSPASRYMLGPIPLMSVVSAIALAFYVFCFWLLFNDPIAGGHGPVQLASIGGLLALGAVMYFATKWYRRRQGLRVELAFKEIPIE